MQGHGSAHRWGCALRMPISPTSTVKREYSSGGMARRLRTSKIEPA